MRQKKLNLSVKDYLNLFEYSREKGELIWKSPPLRNSYLIGKNAGNLNEHGYVQIRLNRKNFLVHRIIWAIEKGFESAMIDHINGNRSDNRIENLKHSNPRLNSNNLKRHREGKLVGATWVKSYNKWWSRIRIKGKEIHLGYFETEKQANEMYMAALQVIK